MSKRASDWCQHASENLCTPRQPWFFVQKIGVLEVCRVMDQARRYWQVLHPPCERQTVEVFSWASQGNEDILRFHLSEVLDEGVEMGDIPLEFVRMRQCQYAVRLVLASTCVAEVQGSLFCR